MHIYCVAGHLVETYGLFEQGPDGSPLPEQKYFHPARSLLQDRVPLPHLNLLCSLTFPQFDPRLSTTSESPPNNSSPTSSPPTSAAPTSSSSSSAATPSPSATPSWSLTALSHLRPGPTKILRLWLPSDQQILQYHLRLADTIIGVNLTFDIPYLRTSPLLRLFLNGRHTLIDFIVVNYLQNEMRQDKSLKAIGPILRLFKYTAEEESRSRTYPSPHDQRSWIYAGHDTHRPLEAIPELCRRILSQFPPPANRETPCPTSEPTSWKPSSLSATASSGPPSPTASSAAPPAPSGTAPGTDKLSPYSVQFFSDSIWSCIRMLESGTPMDAAYLRHLESIALKKKELAHSLSTLRFGCPLQNGHPFDDDGCLALQKSTFATLLASCPSDPSSSKLFEFTDKKREVSLSDLNRLLVRRALPGNSEVAAATDPSSAISFIRKCGWRDYIGHQILALWDIHADASKLTSTYTYPLLRHKAKEPDKQNSILLPWPYSSLSSTSPRSSPSSVSSSTSPRDLGSYRHRTPKQYQARHQRRRLKRTPWSAPPKLKAKADQARLEDAVRPLVPTRVRRLPHSLPLPSTVIPLRSPDILVAYPKIFLIPSKWDSSDDTGGGQKQARLSFKDPALQTFPSRIKKAIRSRFKGGVFVHWDASQIELRDAALLSGDTTLLKAFAENLDLHSQRADSVFHAELLTRYPAPLIAEWIADRGKKDPLFEDFSERFRQPAKHANFTDLNLGQAQTLQLTILKKSSILVPLSICQLIVDRRPLDRPGLHAWQQELIAKARRDGRIELPYTGISRLYLGGQKLDDSEIVNLPIQGVAATTVREIQHHLDRHTLPSLSSLSPDILSCYNVYDAGGYDCRTQTAADRLLAGLREAFAWVQRDGYWGRLQAAFGRTVPLLYDVKLIQ